MKRIRRCIWACRLRATNAHSQVRHANENAKRRIRQLNNRITMLFKQFGKGRKEKRSNSKKHESKNCPKQCECLCCVWPNKVLVLFIGQFIGEISKSPSTVHRHHLRRGNCIYIRAFDFDQLLSPNDLKCTRPQLD